MHLSSEEEAGGWQKQQKVLEGLLRNQENVRK